MILAKTANIFLGILEVLILARVLLSWFRPRYRTSRNSWFFSIDEMIWRATEPMLAPIRNILPTGGMGFDFSPIILLLLIQFLGRYIVAALARTGI
ncbi:MAG TPA: YggT family protein [Symbiobacteriaceae bacterium]|nr:YggT family protein [Symbiobacteriaceae bacterium]